MQLFSSFDLNYIVILIGVVMIIVEILLGAITGFELFVLGIIFMVAGGIGMAFGGSFLITLGIIILLISAYIVFARGYIKEKLTVITHKTNADSLVGKHGKVEHKITSSQAGRVRVGTESWRAEADETLEKDTLITVASISGVTLHVHKKK